MSAPSIGVILPCLNESATIEQVVADFKQHLPAATVYVVDNQSSDETAAIALRAGAHVLHEQNKGKGHAVRRGFNSINTDIYLIADGDGTYDITCASKMVDMLCRNHLDMVIGVRQADDKNAYRFGHRWGNQFFSYLFSCFFRKKFTDVFSGYRCFSRRYVKSFPLVSSGFELETEMCVHAVQLGMPTDELITPYRSRQTSSPSKLNTLKDGGIILVYFLFFIKQIRPFLFFFTITLIFAIASCVVGVPIVIDYLSTGLVPRLPSAVLAASLGIVAFVSLFTGIIMHGIALLQWEQKRLIYLSIGTQKSD